jgi:hypothetical protein
MKRRVGRPSKPHGAPVEHKLTPKMRLAIIALVENGENMDQAAASAGLTKDAIYRALKNPPVRQFYHAELKLLLTAAKAKAVHSLIKELDGTNAAARVAAARTLLEHDKAPQIQSGMPQTAGFGFLIIDGRTQQQKAIDITPTLVTDESAEDT